MAKQKSSRRKTRITQEGIIYNDKKIITDYDKFKVDIVDDNRLTITVGELKELIREIVREENNKKE
jgi:hypothetical protein